ncbi:lytic murein transglycosylase [Nonomuraea sp. NPDC050328]|uniref:lytic transglycosylase domain-containing protein n=1 Tax=Nonomuraea sp. NPDC050328 TaxID=3364361 RepID=UPI0037BB061F
MNAVRLLPLLPLIAALTGCAGGTEPAAGQIVPNVSPAPTITLEEPPAAVDAPAPDVAIPTGPAKLAAALKKTTTELYAGIDAWVDSGKARPPQHVVLLALHHQRIYRTLARDSALTASVVRRLPRDMAVEARANTTAVGKLLAMARPITAAQRKKIRLATPLPAGRLRGYMLRAERRFGVEWEVLAAIMLVETRFGRITSSSSTGAQGPMQFMPGTWRAYGMGGDVHDARDAIAAAANYLKASGAPKDYRRAVFAYNHDTRYVDAVLAHAEQIKRDPRSFYAYYNWQIFVLSGRGTAKEDVRLTGPR